MAQRAGISLQTEYFVSPAQSSRVQAQKSMKTVSSVNPTDESNGFEVISIRSEKETQSLRLVLRTQFAINFNMSILKMALNMKEDAVAGCLAAKYAVRVEL